MNGKEGFQFPRTKHCDEPLNARIVSAMASTICCVSSP